MSETGFASTAEAAVRSWPVRPLRWDNPGQGAADLRFLLARHADGGARAPVRVRDGHLHAADGTRTRPWAGAVASAHGAQGPGPHRVEAPAALGGEGFHEPEALAPAQGALQARGG